MSYQIEFTKGAIKQLKKLPVEIKERIDSKIIDLAIDPRPSGVKKLKNTDNTYRVRVDDYRILYDIAFPNLLRYLVSKSFYECIAKKNVQTSV